MHIILLCRSAGCRHQINEKIQFQYRNTILIIRYNHCVAWCRGSTGAWARGDSGGWHVGHAVSFSRASEKFCPVCKPSSTADYNTIQRIVITSCNFHLANGLCMPVHAMLWQQTALVLGVFLSSPMFLQTHSQVRSEIFSCNNKISYHSTPGCLHSANKSLLHSSHLPRALSVSKSFLPALKSCRRTIRLLVLTWGIYGAYIPCPVQMMAKRTVMNDDVSDVWVLPLLKRTLIVA